MKTLNSFFGTITLIILFYSTIMAQLDLSVYADKETYEYGETIRLYAKVTNTADTTFEFLAGNYENCQAEFSFNDFNSWEYATCLPTAQMLTFKPHSSKIYSWIIEPQSLGLPNKDGSQTIIGHYYFNLSDTIFIQAPRFIGGEIRLTFHEDYLDSIYSLGQQLNVNVVHGDHFGEIKSEVWQIEGYDIDSLINIYSNDLIFVSFEKSIWIRYENIVDENPLDYYPLQIGNKWYYEQIELENIIGPNFNFIVTDTISVEVLADTLMPNGLKYFILNNNFGTGNIVRSTSDGIYYYNGNNSSDVLVFDYFANLDEYYSVDLEITSRVSLFSNQKDVMFTDSISSLVYVVDGLVPYTISFAQGLGLTYFTSGPHEPLIYKLIGCEINNKVYGTTPIVGIKDNRNETPIQFSLSQNYPNPFNPTTIIKYQISNNKSQINSKSQGSNRVVLKVYDALGKEVTTLVNETKQPGTYHATFDASNLASGMYYYRLSVGDFSETKKMILLK